MYRVVWSSCFGDYWLAVDRYPISTKEDLSDADLADYEFESVDDAMLAVDSFCDDPAAGASYDDLIEIIDCSDFWRVARRFRLDVQIYCSTREVTL